MTPPRRRGPRAPVINKTILSMYLRRMRLAAGITQAEAAATAGLDRSQWNAYEKGRRSMEVTKAPLIARVFDVSPDEVRALAEERGAVAELAVQLSDHLDRIEALERGANGPPPGQEEVESRQ